jgi:hypothetical protein
MTVFLVCAPHCSYVGSAYTPIELGAQQNQLKSRESSLSHEPNSYSLVSHSASCYLSLALDSRRGVSPQQLLCYRREFSSVPSVPVERIGG